MNRLIVAGRCGLLLCALAVTASGTLYAQALTAGIAGTVKDSTGAVLPGVTVEAASPALIEKVRSVTTDDKGNYKIIDLRPGIYSVTFTLPGFGTLKRDGVELVTGFTATVNGDLKVGALEETVTVTGASPVVDTQSSRAQQVLKSEVMDALPTGTKSIMQFAAMTLGAMPSRTGSNDVGGDKGEQATGIVLHGGRGDDGRTNYDGMYGNMIGGDGGGMRRVYYFNAVGVQEVVVDTGGNSAEIETGGANVNMIPREGGNQFKVYSLDTFTNSSFASKGVPDDIIARGVGPQPTVRKIYDYGVGIGGPLVHDRLWFYTANRWWGSQQYGANNYFNKSTNPYQYVPDLSKPAYANTWFHDNGVRLTWQASRRNKFTQEEHLQYGCSCWLGVGSGALVSPEAASSNEYGPQIFSQTSWTYTATSKLLIQAGSSLLNQGTRFTNDTTVFGRPGPTNFSITDVGTGRQWGMLPYIFQTFSDADTSSFNEKGAMSYVTGSHAFKAGAQLMQAVYDLTGLDIPNKVAYTFRNGSPISLTEWAAPLVTSVRAGSQAFYAQDQWTLHRLTLNVGLRYNHFQAHTRPLTIPAGPFTAQRSVPEVDRLPDYKDLTPRIGAAFDVWGNGKTALKGGWGRYLYGQGGARSVQLGPSLSIVQNVTRTWNDANGNFVPDCDLVNPIPNGECGQISNLAFGQPVTNLSIADNLREGWNVRAYNYQTSVQVQQELRPGVGLAIGYFRTNWKNQVLTQNTLVGPSDFTSYCITAPTNTLLGPNSGKQICGIYNVNPAKFGQSNSVIRLAKDFGTPREVFNGLDMAVNARWGRGGLLAGGITLGRTDIDNCYLNNRPDLLQEGQLATQPRNSDFCHISSPIWSGIGSQAKIQAVYPLPWDVQLSGTFKNLPGIPLTSNLVLTNAQVAPALGRDLAGCAVSGAACPQTTTISLIPFSNNGGDVGSATASGTVFDKRLNEVDLRITKAVRVRSGKLQGLLDIYNIFNNRAPQAINTTYGAAFGTPTALLGSRLVKLGIQVEF